MSPVYIDPIIIRNAHEGDSGAIERLAALDSKRLPAGPFLLAEVDGEARAAFSVSDGIAVADPFYPSAKLVELMRVRLSVPDRTVEHAMARGLRTAHAVGR
jgi:hypothetical protein